MTFKGLQGQGIKGESKSNGIPVDQKFCNKIQAELRAAQESAFTTKTV